MFSIKSSRKIVATILAKDEEDIIGKNIEHHINQGVTHFIITNNRSKDKTKEIIEKYPEVVEIIDEPGEDHNQSAWVTRMARLACKLNPDWIIHLDADEFWCNISELRFINSKYIGNAKVYIHPPRNCNFDLNKMRFYLNFKDEEQLHSECKVAHRPDPDVIITHGNHGFENKCEIVWPHKISRHHYPVRGYDQFLRKCVEGHEALQKRGSVCERWKKWKDLHDQCALKQVYDNVCKSWDNMIKNINKEDLINILEFWSTPEVVEYVKNKNIKVSVEEWPKFID